MQNANVFRHIAAALLGAAVAGTSGSVKADPIDPQKIACADAYDETQALRTAGKLQAARAQAVVCARDVCTDFIRKDCAKWVEEIDARLPTVTVEAIGPDGQEARDVQVTLDGAPWLASLDKRPMPIDPGPHQVVFAMEGAPPVTQTVEIREGEKNRKLTAIFETTAPAPTPTPPERANLTGPIPPGGSKYAHPGMMVTGIVFTSVGAVLVAAGAATLPNAEQEHSFVLPIEAFIMAGIHLGVGVPLWAVGARPSKSSQAQALLLSPYVPELGWASGRAQLRWAF